MAKDLIFVHAVIGTTKYVGKTNREFGSFGAGFWKLTNTFTQIHISLFVDKVDHLDVCFLEWKTMTNSSVESKLTWIYYSVYGNNFFVVSYFLPGFALQRCLLLRVCVCVMVISNWRHYTCDHGRCVGFVVEINTWGKDFSLCG